jgi:hypothetical protein
MGMQKNLLMYVTLYSPKVFVKESFPDNLFSSRICEI